MLLVAFGIFYIFAVICQQFSFEQQGNLIFLSKNLFSLGHNVKCNLIIS